MKKLLIIGGTRFLGLEFLKLVNGYEIYIASRRKIKTKNFILIDRKSQQDLDNLFEDIQYDPQTHPRPHLQKDQSVQD